MKGRQRGRKRKGEEIRKEFQEFKGVFNFRGILLEGFKEKHRGGSIAPCEGPGFNSGHVVLPSDKNLRKQSLRGISN